MRGCRFRRRSRGVTLVLALAFLVLLGALAMTTFALVGGHAIALNREVQRTQARYLAEEGVSIARQQLRRNPSWSGGRFVRETGTVVVRVQRRGGDFWVESRSELSHSAFAPHPLRAVLRVRWKGRDGRIVAWEWRPAHR